jgi:1-acyl-sn-glycerol-3-phosphate acyltransferase
VATAVSAAGLPDRTRMNFSYRMGWRGFRLLFRYYFGWQVFSAERVPARGPVILASNHASFMDPPLVGAGVDRHVNFLARDNIFKVPLLAALLRSWQVVPVDRDGGSGRGLKLILRRLEAGGAIILFPEGTRTRHGEFNPARSGIGLTVIKSSAPVVPARVFGTRQAFGPHMWFPRPRPVMVKYGYPMSFAALRAEAATCSRHRLKEIYQRVADEIMAEIIRLQPGKDS